MSKSQLGKDEEKGVEEEEEWKGKGINTEEGEEQGKWRRGRLRKRGKGEEGREKRRK